MSVDVAVDEVSWDSQQGNFGYTLMIIDVGHFDDNY